MSVSPRFLIVFLIMCTLMILPGCSFPGFKPRPSTPEQPAPKQGTYIAMLLPTSGSLGSITTKIMRGANLAASELRQKKKEGAERYGDAHRHFRQLAAETFPAAS